jgi:hypothetical protein
VVGESQEIAFTILETSLNGDAVFVCFVLFTPSPYLSVRSVIASFPFKKKIFCQ